MATQTKDSFGEGSGVGYLSLLTATMSKITFEATRSFASRMDRLDPLRKFRSRFHYPKKKGKEVIYLTGNSLGLQPCDAAKYVQQELEDWARLGVEGHFHARRPWTQYDQQTKKTLAKLTGAKPTEVVAMNQLTVNLHLMLVSFYQPSGTRYKILTEAGAFPSDQYAIASQIRFHGYDPKEAWIEVAPRVGEHTLRTEDIIQTIRQVGDELALVLLGGVQYYTGQFFDMKKITAATHEVGAFSGWDLAHAIGNVPLQLHKHEVDFAVWCTYKYLNSGPGAVAGAFIHEKYFHNASLPRFEGWWGNKLSSRFKMRHDFERAAGVDAWQLSTYTVMNVAAHLASLRLFEEVEFKPLLEKSKLLTGYAEFLLKALDPMAKHLEIITPKNPKERGCQLSLRMVHHGRKIFEQLLKQGVIVDWREPGVIRIAPVPLYNTFSEVYAFYGILKSLLHNLTK
jgi:kynureninase